MRAPRRRGDTAEAVAGEGAPDAGDERRETEGDELGPGHADSGCGRRPFVGAHREEPSACPAAPDVRNHDRKERHRNEAERAEPGRGRNVAILQRPDPEHLQRGVAGSDVAAEDLRRPDRKHAAVARQLGVLEHQLLDRQRRREGDDREIDARTGGRGAPPASRSLPPQVLRERGEREREPALEELDVGGDAASAACASEI
jgi:hypothetical protein